MPQEGLHYYAIQNLNTGEVEQRGITGSNGIAFSSLIVSPDTPYRVWILQARTLAVAQRSIITPGNGRRFEVPALDLHTSRSRDRDGDGLHDEGELILGTINDPTNPNTQDSDQDGILDGAEVLQGLNPTDGLAVRTGLIGTADTPGTAVDVCALNDIVAVADSDAGVTVFNVFNGMQPLAIAQVNTPGTAERVACTDMVIAVADGSNGLAIIDISDPPAARVRQQVRLSSAARSVVAAGGVAYVGLEGGQVVAVDLATGSVLEEIVAGGSVHDLGIEGDTLFVLLAGELQAYSLLPDFEFLGRATPLSFFPEGITQRRRLFVGGGIAYVTSFPGFDTFNVSNPSAMQRVGSARDAGPNSFKQIIANGSGLGIAAVGVNPRDDGTHDVFLYNVTDPANTTAVITQFATPGLTRAVSLYNGIAFAADGAAGLQVVNYLAFDNRRVPPTITISTNFANGVAEEGKVVRVSAVVSDDVQVRNVEFYVDGQKIATDGNFPFEHRFIAPRLRDKPSFTLQARASDTGGNATFTDELVITLVPDATPPRVRRTAPRDGAVVPAQSAVAAFFSEPLNPSTLTAQTYKLISGGPDRQLDTPDDVELGGTIEFRDEVLGAFLTFAQRLGANRYRATLSAAVTDLAGNPLTAPVTWSFTIFDVGADRDGDGVPDDLERLLGLDPDNADSDGDGTSDGDEDFDNDGLPNFGEVVVGTDPTDADSDDDGVRDGDEDEDQDGLTDSVEVRRGTNPRGADTDGDGWPDGAEVDAGSNPVSSASQPRFGVIAAPAVTVVRLGLEEVAGLAPNTTVAAPPVTVVLQGLEDEQLSANVTVAQPPVSVVLQGIGETGGTFTPNTTVAQPPVAVVLQATGAAGGLAPNTTVAPPPVTVRIAGQ